MSKPVTSDKGTATPAAKRTLLIGLLLAVTLHAFAELAIITALPVVSRDLDGASLYGIAFSAYLLTSLISIVWSGHMTDERGPVMPFVAGLIVFSIGLVLAALAPTMWTFVLARAVQGLGGGAFSAVVSASVNRGWKDHERAHIMAMLSSAWIIPGLLAPGAAGAIAEYWDWRWIFIILLPFVAVALALSLKGLKALGPGEVHTSVTGKTLDAVRIALGLTLFLAALTRQFDALSALMVIAGPALAARPLVRILPPGTGASRRTLLASLGVRFMLTFGFFGAETFLPLGLVEVRGLTAFAAGIVLTAASLSWSGAAFIQSRYSQQRSPRTLAVTGMAITAVSVLSLIVLLAEGTPFWWSYVLWTIAGGGIGMAYNTVATSAMAHTVKGKEGATSIASGLVDGGSIALAAGLGGAILNQVERQDAGLQVGIGLIWVLSAMVLAAGAVVAALYMERTVRHTALETKADGVQVSSQTGSQD